MHQDCEKTWEWDLLYTKQEILDSSNLKEFAYNNFELIKLMESSPKG